MELRSRRVRAAVLAAAVGMGGLAVAGTPAAAAPHYDNAPSVQVGYTDAATPRSAYDTAEGVHMPLGSSVDAAGVTHTSRVYATFDLARLRGSRFLGSTLRIREFSAADCGKRAIELWRTEQIGRTPSWRRAPAEIAKVDEILTPEYCPTADISFDTTAVINEALAAGDRKVSFVLRVPAAHEADPTYGRRLNWYHSVSLGVQYNTVPKIDNKNLYNGGVPCVANAPYPVLGYHAGNLQAVGTDADSGDQRSLRFDYALWPKSDPAARTERSVDGRESGRAATTVVPEELLADGVTYAWQARVGDGLDVSAWSKVCYFVADRTAPPAAQVTSPNYPLTGGPFAYAPLGEPGTFTFSGNGDADVAGFVYGWGVAGVRQCTAGELGQLVCPDLFTAPGAVRAHTPGGTATVSLNPPGTYNTLEVMSVDVAGRTSAPVRYQISLSPSSYPAITVVGGEPEWNKPVTLRFSTAAGIVGTTEYEYQLDGVTHTVPAGEDGTATITFVADRLTGFSVNVRSHSANGWISPSWSKSVQFLSRPGVASAVYPADQVSGGVGVPGAFTFSPPPGWTQVQGYQYSFANGDYLFVAAGQDGRATVTWTPEASGNVLLDVFAIDTNDNWSEYSNMYWFDVA
ncbi:hypothetical protein Cme02nite_25080 [Catellatospora methionotrophica]|uniref:DNRLRE domain-containing protein n=1 Tax=Catellatospora methionotrophica TaxID=121620 RepID=A0A8J3PE47_9ACTN|nr:hypothetical protein [Catellatospora methionotrophica]GIG14176.1 hypothetical protein Cme02nite_25080 [Catellatospora methionotrophica]